MLERVGSFSYSQALLGEYSRIQARTLKTQAQIASGKIGDQFADAKDKASVLAAAKMKAAGVEAFSATTKEVLSRLDLQDLHLRELSDVSARLRAAIGDVLSTGRAPAFMDEVRHLYAEVLTILNAKVDGKYIYGGSRTDQPPVNAATLADLVAAPVIGDVFNNTSVKQTQRIDESEMLETGMLASDLGLDLMQMFKDIAVFDAGAGGPFAMTTTPAQITFLTGQHVALPAVQSDINVYAAINGSRHAQASAAFERHESMAAYFAKFIGDIEDVDLAEAVARLNQDQVAAEAAGRMIGRASCRERV